MPDLKINISADAQAAVAGFKSTATAVKDFGSALGDAREKVETLRAKLELLNTTALKGGPGKALAKDLTLAKDQLKSLEQQAGITGQATGNAFTGAYSAIRKLAYALPGIGVAGLIGLAVEPLISLVKYLGEATNATSEFKTQQEVIGQVAEKAGENFAAQSVTISQLIKTTRDHNLSLEDRRKALAELIRLDPKHLEGLTLSNIELEKGANIVNNYVQALKRQATAEAALDILKEDQTKKVKAQFALDVENQQFQSKIDNAAKVRVTNAKLYGQQAVAYIDAEVIGIKSKHADLIKDYQKTIDEVSGRESALDKLIKNNQSDVKFDDSKLKKTKTLTSDQELNKEIAAINKEIAALQELQKQGVATKADIQELFALRIKKLDLEFDKSGFSLRQLQALKGKLQDEAGKAFAADPLTFKLDTIRVVLPDEAVKLTGKNKNVLPDNIKVVDTSKALKSAIDAGKGMGLTIRKGLQDGIGQVDIGAGLASIVQSNLISGFEDIGAALGDAVSGAGLGKVLHAAENSIGQFIVDFGRLLIKSGIEALALKNAVKSLALTPAVAIAAGIAAIALGQIIKNASQPKAPKAFAEGGIVTGPTHALIGEAGPEVVFPLAKLNQFIKGIAGGGSHQFEFSPIEMRQRGSDLYGVLQAQQKKVNRGLS
ncbi:MAG: hypothetical protein H0X33_14785 [Taibaiella sp.]|nr:hypothetical protein [Taibaiella sp.]